MPRFQVPGLLNLNKPVGMTSRGVVDVVGRVARTRRAGHAGTLDPLATGVLVVCLDWATRLVPFVQQLPKQYRAEFRLGQTSDTDDVTGVVEPVANAIIPERSVIEAALPAFVGRIQQVPPAHSAIHVGGRRAYDFAREGEAVELAPRPVDVYRIAIVACEGPRLVLDIECGSGTYVRSIGRDLGRKLGCGAMMTALERRAIGPFRIEDAISPEALDRDNLASHVLPPVAAVRHLPSYVCPSEHFLTLQQGRLLPAAAELTGETAPHFAILDDGGTLLGLAEPARDRQALQPRHVFCVERK